MKYVLSNARLWVVQGDQEITKKMLCLEPQGKEIPHSKHNFQEGELRDKATKRNLQEWGGFPSNNIG